jgi:uncharacterized oxidoreductase
MKLSGRTVLITGGATGIGLGLAEAFMKAGSTVIVCGRRAAKLEEAKARFPQLHTRVCDVGRADQRRELAKWVTAQFPALDVLVNNAGIQREVDLWEEGDWEARQQEIAINFEAPVHLTTLLVPHLLKQPEAAILNVSSGLAFTPMARMPIYCATKAALHSFTMSLRRQLRDTNVKVVEIIPPMVDTELDQGARERRGQTYRGVSVEEFIQGILPGLERGDAEVAYGTAERGRQASRAEIEEIFERMNAGPVRG